MQFTIDGAASKLHLHAAIAALCAFYEVAHGEPFVPTTGNITVHVANNAGGFEIPNVSRDQATVSYTHL